MRYRADKTLQLVHTLQAVVDQWITHVSFSSWILVHTGTCKNVCREAHVAYAASDGTVGFFKVTQTFEQPSDQDTTTLRLTFNTEVRLHGPNITGVTGLSWVEIPDKRRILVYTKPGILYLWCPPSPNIGWTGYRSFRLQTQKLSVSSSALHPSSSVQYIRPLDALLLTLFDGSFHVFHNLSSEPSTTPRSTPGFKEPVTSENLSNASRSIFIQSEEGVEFSDMNRITGLTSYDGSSTFIWIQECVVDLT
ncbi:hypothetical protein DXG03_006352 [Asterophora parasitica]|uniref:Uncharacterized protein n=1 Tax=Asterophora parasitica TaxID=117018 RepID=A0A9P7G7P2_9AGAR|nr:hypothetical protein DXG03_006352 [Asterophora parasitica]